MTNPIDLVFCLHQKSSDSPYPMALAANYVSIRQRTSHLLRLHLIVDSTVEESSLERLRATLQGDDQFCVLDSSAVPEADQVARETPTSYSPAVVWRAWLPEYLPSLQRCLVLDCDLIALTDVHRIWSIELNGKTLAALLRRKPRSKAYHDWIQTAPDRYFRMCICLMDLDSIRANKTFIKERIAFLQLTARQRHEMKEANLLEQSLFNRYLSDSFLALNLDVPAPNYLRSKVTEEHFKNLGAHTSNSESLGLIVDLKGWTNQSPECLYFWSALLETPWREEAIA